MGRLQERKRGPGLPVCSGSRKSFSEGLGKGSGPAGLARARRMGSLCEGGAHPSRMGRWFSRVS